MMHGLKKWGAWVVCGLLLAQGWAACVDARPVRPGEQLYQRRCAACHGADGHGAMGPDLQQARLKGMGHLLAVIKAGRQRKGMPRFQGQFSEAELRELVEHILKMP